MSFSPSLSRPFTTAALSPAREETDSTLVNSPDASVGGLVPFGLNECPQKGQGSQEARSSPESGSGSKRRCRESCEPYLSSEEERISPESDDHSTDVMESVEKPHKMERKERASGGDAMEEEEENLIPPRGPLPPPAVVVAVSSPSLSSLTAAGTVPRAPTGVGLFHFPHIAAAAPTTRGACTRLRSIAQLAELIGDGTAAAGVKRSSTGETVSAVPLRLETAHRESCLPATYLPAAAVAAPLALHAGETVIFILHRGRESVAELVNPFTEHLSQVRVFTLDLAALPPQDYEEAPDPPSDEAAGDGGDKSRPDAVPAEEEETLFVAGHAAPDTQQQQRQQQQRNSGGWASHRCASLLPSLGTAAYTMTGELSEELNQVTETAMNKVRRLLRVETVLNPDFFQGEEAGSTDSGEDQRSQKAEPLLLPAMVVWRAAGAAREDYSPYLPCSYSDGSTPSLSQQQQQFSAFSRGFAAQLSTQQHYTQSQQQTLSDAVLSTKRRYSHFGDYLCANGGALVVKQLNNIDYVHSLSLYTPVYTVAHLYKHIIETAKRRVLAKYHKLEELAFPSSFSPAPEADRAGNAEKAQNFYRLLDRENVKSRTVIYLGASWCPPCMRIVGDMPNFIKDNFVLADPVMKQLTDASCGNSSGSSSAHLTSSGNSTNANERKGLHAFVKADMDLAKPLFDLLKVQVIPTFLILDNNKLFELERRFLRERDEAASSGQPPAVQQSEKLMGEAILQAELGRLQNSQRDLINVFIEKHCTSLSFDEDF